LSSKDYFGEIALMTSKARQATVIAQENVSVLCIDHATFTRVLTERSRELLKRNMEEYENILS
jgi:cAMP-dependent protein kinase regulator